MDGLTMRHLERQRKLRPDRLGIELQHIGNAPEREAVVHVVAEEPAQRLTANRAAQAVVRLGASAVQVVQRLFQHGDHESLFGWYFRSRENSRRLLFHCRNRIDTPIELFHVSR